jgi:hypothetical protein
VDVIYSWTIFVFPLYSQATSGKELRVVYLPIEHGAQKVSGSPAQSKHFRLYPLELFNDAVMVLKGAAAVAVVLQTRWRR